jgi:predicted dehydrogenase
MKTILIGFGDIAPKHVEVLEQKNCKVVGLVTKNYQNAILNTQKYNLGTAYKSIDDVPYVDIDFFIVMVKPEFTATILKKLIPLGKPILVEKPASFSSKDLSDIIDLKNKHNCKVMVAMNRRFYSIYQKTIDFLSKNNLKLDYISVEAPERFSDIMKEKFSEITRKNWMYCNPIHCIDLIRFFGGDLLKINSNSNPKKYLFNAIGSLSDDVQFSYVSNWKSSGSWSITLYAKDTRIVFNPIEQGIIFYKNQTIKLVPDVEDISFKAGFLRQIDCFLDYSFNNKLNVDRFSDLEDHKKTLELIEHIYF